MNTQRKMNTRLSLLCKGLRQLGYAALAALPMLGSAQAATDEVVYFHTDALGSPVAAFSETGEVCWTESYSPYGEKLDKEDSLTPAAGCGLLGTDVGYTGHVQDGSGLVYAQQRYYDPVIGRFMSTDPITPSAGAPHMFGRYQYANNSPYNYTDPTGMVGDNWGVEGHESYACSACGTSTYGDEDGAYRGNEGETQGNGVHGIGREGEPLFDENHPKFHSYNVSNSCSKGGAGCTLDNIANNLLINPAPSLLSQSTPVKTGDVSYALPVGSVTHVVDPMTKAVINITKKTHLLDPGIVKRWTTEDANSVTVHTYGEGTGNFGAANEYLSEGLWGGVDEKIFK